MIPEYTDKLDAVKHTVMIKKIVNEISLYVNA